jgi:phospholipid/cholesterol/gamma-HCH transport system ATP-binding protein
MTPAQIKQRVQEALHMVGLEEAEDKLPSDLSGGMRKRAALARLLAYRPHILLYDEPTTGLDPLTAMQINELIVKTQKELKATSIVVTHDLQSALIVGNRLAFHSDGKIAYVANKEQFVETDNPLIQKFLKAAVPKKPDDGAFYQGNSL